ncbi:hypothetical protein BDP27DRAFT_1407735 [Rhodocollybia butyracea]|uniref:Uncharacterized protein n=1 Tax=Rhodocollybia butyracea TaxID=206335 RepID=A0A9P5TZA2_9AGAR|nr:hypothetical protein BDP27DRAFT_1407735 [Rhodocollybia butyracea]
MFHRQNPSRIEDEIKAVRMEKQRKASAAKPWLAVSPMDKPWIQLKRAQVTANDVTQVNFAPSMGLGTDVDGPTLPAFLSLLLHPRFSTSVTTSNTTTSLNFLNSACHTSTAPTSAIPTFSPPPPRLPTLPVPCARLWNGGAQCTVDALRDGSKEDKILTLLQPLLIPIEMPSPSKIQSIYRGEIRGLEEMAWMPGALEVCVRAQTKVAKETREARERKEGKEVLD